MDQRTTTSNFLARYGAKPFPHREELLALLAAGVALEGTPAPAPAAELLRVYRIRVRHIERLVAERGAALDPALGVDVLAGSRALVAALEARDAPALVRVWSAAAPGGVVFFVFADEAAGRVLACVRGYDQRTRPYEHGPPPESDAPDT